MSHFVCLCYLVVEMGRPRKWSPKVVDEAALHAIREFCGQYLSSARTELRVVNEFVEFIVLNELLEDADGILAWIGSMRSAPLMYSTIQTYLGYVLKSKLVRKNSEVLRIANGVALAHAEEDGVTAEDISHEEGEAIASGMDEFEDRLTAHLMLSTGARHRDLRRLAFKQFLSCEENALDVEFRVTKTRRRRGFRVRLVLDDLLEMTGHTLPEDVVEYIRMMKETQPDAGVVSGTVTLFNSRMQRVVQRSTSYSLRKRYIRSIVRFVNRDFAAAQEYTLHFDPHVLKAYYDNHSPRRPVRPRWSMRRR